jgi:class 3 adenylate cyclase
MTSVNTIRSLPLTSLEPRLRHLLPADLYAEAWMDQTPANLERVFEHLRTLHRILVDYVPRQLGSRPPEPGRIRREWEEGALIFTDLSGFTPLMEANAARGQEGAATLLGLLNHYFASMIEIVSKSGGEILEFTGDAMLIQFAKTRRGNETAQAVRAGMRMQRAMYQFENIQTDIGEFTLGMRVGIHVGRYLTADIGTPRRMEHILLGQAVQATKIAEGAGKPYRVNLTTEAYERVKDEYHFEPGDTGYMLAIDDLTDDQLGTFDIGVSRRRMGGQVLLDRSVIGLTTAIEDMLGRVEPLAAFVPRPVLNLLVESAAQREIEPSFPMPTVMFVNLIGLPESVDEATEEEVNRIVQSFSEVFSMINAAVEHYGGVLKKVTYHLSGSDMMIIFGSPVAHSDDPTRAAAAALRIKNVIESVDAPTVRGKKIELSCQIGMSYGPVFAAEIGEPRGRREFNILGDTVNTAARLMGKAIGGRILVSEWLYPFIKDDFELDSLGSMPLKGKSRRVKLYSLIG